MEQLTIQIQDQTAAGKPIQSISVRLPQQLVTVAQIIEVRVRAEVAAHNEKRDTGPFRGLVMPRVEEQQLNGPGKVFRPRLIDADEQVRIALEAFDRNGFFLLIDDHQPLDLQQTFLLQPDSRISFVKLTPLVGG